MALELGDHVWYWNHKISTDKNIPRAQWFPGSNPHVPTDYQGHGKEIYHFVIHADEIARGRPHMRNHEGSFAWLNNNPGNLTGYPGGPDYGQYQGKFNWHNFLIFPTWGAGYDAIGKFLRNKTYAPLSILDAFKKYAPESDGNRPVQYANAVATSLGVPVSTWMGALDDRQMLVIQDKIMEIEGAVPGDSLAWGSPEIPAEISALLPALNREFGGAGGAFTIDLSAPVDPAGFTRGFGGPGQGGHQGGDWFVSHGMDLGGAVGTPVYAAFDGHVTKHHPHNPANDSRKVYGAQIFMRAPNDLMGAFYTHLTNVPSGLRAGSRVSRGDFLGTVYGYGGISPHLHLALVEIIGGPQAKRYKGVDLYRLFLRMQTSPGMVVPVRFWQDGRAPEPLSGATQELRIEIGGSVRRKGAYNPA